jgi:hypothetical protein
MLSLSVRRFLRDSMLLRIQADQGREHPWTKGRLSQGTVLSRRYFLEASSRSKLLFSA